MLKKETECFISTQEMLAQKGYHTVVPKIGELGKALMQASKEEPECKWLKKHLDQFFKELRRENKRGKRNEYEKQNC